MRRTVLLNDRNQVDGVDDRLVDGVDDRKTGAGGRATRTGFLFAMAAVACLASCDPVDTVTRNHLDLTAVVPAVRHFAILATHAVSLGDRDIVTGGGVGVGAAATGAPHTMTVGFDARVAIGQVLLAPVITLRDRAVVGAIGADQVHAAASVVTGPRSAYVPPPRGPAPGPFAVGSKPAVTVDGGRMSSLGSAAYGPVTVNGTLTLQGGLYELQSLRVGPDGRVISLAPSTVRIVTNVSASDRARIQPAAGSTAGDLRFMVAGSIVLGADAQLTALVVAQHGFRAGDRLTARGAIAAEDVVFGNDGRLTFEGGFGCGTPVDCDDANECSTETCDDARCVVITVPAGTPCDDGDGCTATSSCQAGTCVGANPIVCDAPDACHLRGTCQAATGRCVNPVAPDGTVCDDGNVCTTDDVCGNGACAAGGGTLVTEYPAGMVRPRSIVKGPDQNLWFVSPETAPGAADGAVGRLTAATGAVSVFPTDKTLNDIAPASDGNLWLAERLPTDQFGLMALGRITTAGTFLSDLIGLPADRVLGGPDDNLWFSSSADGLHLVGSVMTTADLITNLLIVGNAPRDMTTGPDGSVWLVESNGGRDPAAVARVTTSGVLDEFPVPTPGDLNGIVTGLDGKLWFTDEGGNAIGRIDSDGRGLIKFPVPTRGSGLHGITVGPDGNLWFTERVANKIGRITPTGEVTELACFRSADSDPSSITAGPDGRLWITQSATGTIARFRLP